MSTLREIRSRIQSVINVKQITNAMEKVAVARLHKAQAIAEQTNLFMQKLSHVLEDLSSASQDFNHPFFKARPVKKVGLVVIAGDRGLCGSYNTLVLNRAHKFIKKYKPGEVDLILIGKKAISHFKHKNLPIKLEIKDWGGKIQFKQIQELSDKLVNWYLTQELDEIWLIYTHFITILQREVVEEKFLNLTTTKKKKNINFIFEPNPEEIYNELLPRYCVTKIRASLYQAYAAELAARAFSMRKATTNAEEMLVRLTLFKNKVRQANITREMIEITTGAEGVKT